MTRPALSTKIPKELIPAYFEPLEYGDPAKNFPPLGDIIKDSARKYPSDVAIIDENGNAFTFATIYEHAKRLAAGLLGKGCKAGSKIDICMPSRVEWAVSFFAAFMIGVAVPADDWVATETNAYIIKHAGISHVVCLAAKARELKNSISDTVKFITVDDRVDGALYYPDLVAKPISNDTGKQLEGIIKSQKSTDLAFILYTSGTTGMPKGAMLTHANIAYNLTETARYLEMSREKGDKLHCAPPFSHCFGCIFGISSAWYAGIPLAIGGKFDPKHAVEQISRLKLTITYGTPTQFRKMLPALEDPKIYPSRLLRTGIMAGEPCPPKLVEKMMQLGCDIRVIYGLTEASPGTNATRSTDPAEKKWTVGRAYRGSVVRVEDPIDEFPMQVGQEGEVVIYGPGVMIGYYNEQQKTADVTSKFGGLKTGDVGIMDKEGYLVISGRIKNILNRGGIKLYPVTIESRMMQVFSDKVEMVAIVGAKDETYGEEVAAVVKLKTGVKMTPQEFIDLCYQQSQGETPLLSHEEVPRYAFVDTMDIPVSGRNKVLKHDLTKTVDTKIRSSGMKKIKPSALS
jgi:fatty-acyl-CoA synthase